MKTTNVSYVSLAQQHVAIKAELLEAVDRVIEHGQFIFGPEVETFEQRFAKLCGVRFAIGVNSGTDALILALRALGIGEGDEVITVPNSFISSTSCISLVGARPVFVDVGEDINMDPTQLERAITPKSKAILPVHLTGRPAAMKEILEVARAHRLSVVEDCAQAVLAEYHGRRVGSLGTLGCFSLHPLKTLNACGDGGVITTDDEGIYEKLKRLRNLGLVSRDNCVVWSSHSRLDTLQAAILLVKMKYVFDWTEKRRANATFYQRELADLSYIVLPKDRSFEKAVYHTFIIQAEHRNDLRDYLSKRGVETNIHYPLPIHLQGAAADLGYREGSFPVAEQQAKKILSLPCHQDLGEDDLEYVVNAIRDFYGGRN